MASAIAFAVLMTSLAASVQGEKCKCKYDGMTLPPEAAAKAGNPLYGTNCDHKWDNLPGTRYYKNDTECPPSKRCDKGCNYLELAWCYVEPGCEGATYSTTTLPGIDNLVYSYDMCGNPECWNDYGSWSYECPGGAHCNANACKCKFEGGTLPPAAAEKAGNPLYGTSCAFPWDSMPGTEFYKEECEDEHMCSKGCNFMKLPWCYVESGCDGAHSEKTELGDFELFYSYDVCGSPYCWDDYGHWNAGCPGSDACHPTTCAAAKKAYKDQHCCHNPTHEFVIPR